jgi:hypothetical protein
VKPNWLQTLIRVKAILNLEIVVLKINKSRLHFLKAAPTGKEAVQPDASLSGCLLQDGFTKAFQDSHMRWRMSFESMTIMK